jgi:hypothetical protein
LIRGLGKHKILDGKMPPGGYDEYLFDDETKALVERRDEAMRRLAVKEKHNEALVSSIRNAKDQRNIMMMAGPVVRSVILSDDPCPPIPAREDLKECPVMPDLCEEEMQPMEPVDNGVVTPVNVMKGEESF